MANYLVTGGAGFIGSGIVDELVKRKENVRVLDNFSTGKKENLAANLNDIELIVGDIRDESIVKSAVKDIDYIFHQAALPSVPRSFKDPLETLSVNTCGTLLLLTASRSEKIKAFIYASSSSVYGLKSPYAVSKGLGEQYCMLYNRLYGLKTICLRYFNVFGERQDTASPYAAVIPKFIWSLRNNEPVIIYGDGEQTRDFTYVKNVAQANINAVLSGAVGIYNIGCGRQTSVNQLFKYISEILNVDGKCHFAPSRMGDVRNSCADISDAKRILNYRPIMDVKEGLRFTISAYEDRIKRAG